MASENRKQKTVLFHVANIPEQAFVKVSVISDTFALSEIVRGELVARSILELLRRGWE